MNKQLLINGIGMTALTTTTKVMAHLPLLALGRPAEHALTICFGMGTSHRSLLSWDIRATAVELVDNTQLRAVIPPCATCTPDTPVDIVENG